ncbi:Hsp70 family protein [Dactylosporangium sp. CA-233914]|uniref:Hsp70 family protein n=1 Tax=Dactylosporangium sp. CA-233914 TaxID=3239934 RepID=UPI003D8E5980
MVALGVDFGTSHTVAVARWPDGRARPLLFDGSPLLPSAVTLEEQGLVVGRDAVHAARRAPERFEPNPKRRIDDGSVLLGERPVPVPQMMTAVFQRVLAEFTRTAGGGPDAVTVTHPANWASTRRNTLQEAVRQAGLPGATLVPEPVAAATYFVHVLRNMVPAGSAVVVYDLGAGTFDGTVVARTPAGFEVLAVGGRDDLGGLDFDELVVGMIGRALPEEGWARVSADPRAARQLRDEAREAKERLSRAASATVMVPVLDVDVQLTREEFEAAARPLVERSVRVLAETLRLSRLTPDRIAGIFLVGGASQMPLVATELHREFGRAPVTIEQPELVVAEGSVLVGRAVPAESAGKAAPAPATETPASSGALELPATSGSLPVVAPATVVPPAPSVSAPPVSPAVGPVPVSPPMQRPPLRPQMPYPVPQRPVYSPPPVYPPPPPQVVYYPAYAVPPMPMVVPRPLLKGPWSIRWPAGFMTTYGILLYLLTGLLLLVAVLPQLPRANPPEGWDEARVNSLTSGSLEWAGICAVLATLLINGAMRARRPQSGHHWYPLALCLVLGVSNLALTGEGGGYWTLVPAVVFLASTAMLLLPASRRWVRRPPKPPALKPAETSQG